MVSQVAEVENMRKVPAIQTADFLAWLSNRYWVEGNKDQWGGRFVMTFLAKAHYHAFVDEASILTAFNLDGTMKPDARFTNPGIKFPGVE